MALTLAQASVSGTIPVFTIPPGPADIVLYAAASGCYLGTSPLVTTADGMAVSTNPVSLAAFPASGGSKLYATTGSAGSTVNIYFLISTNG